MIEALRTSILVPRDHLHIKHEPMVRHEALCDGHLALSGDSYVLTADRVPGIPGAGCLPGAMASYFARQPPSATRVCPVM